MMDTTIKCEFCDKRGLAVMPVRYTIAPDITGAPKIIAPFKVTDTDEKPIPLKGAVHYTTRLLRTGYLYTFDEARKRWQSYYITKDGNFLNFEIGTPLPAAFVEKVPCARTGHAQVAGMVTISDPKNATNVWFAYSEVEWTKAVLAKHDDEAYRKKHMQMLDVAAALGGGGKPHTHPIADLGNVVSEYNLDSASLKTDYFRVQNPFKYSDKKAATAATIEVAHELRKDKGIILALHDPAGLAVELATIMSSSLAKEMELLKGDGKNNEKMTRQIAVATTIEQMRSGVKENAEKVLIVSVQNLQNQAMADAGAGLIFEGVRNQINKIGIITPAQLDQAKNEEWHKYTHRQSGVQRFNEKAVDAFNREYHARIDKITKVNIDPLGESHVAWAKSQRMANYLLANFDPNDMKSGAAYLESVLQFTNGTEGVTACFKQYQFWLNAKKFDPGNILLRAVAYNNDKMAKQIEEATAFDRRAVPWDALGAMYTAGINQLGKGHDDRVALFMARMAGPIGMAVHAAIDGALRPVMAVLGAFIGGWQRMEFKGTSEDLYKFMVQKMIESTETKLTPSEIQAAVDLELKRINIRGGAITGNSTTTWLVCANKQDLKSGKFQFETPSSLKEIRFQKVRTILGAEARRGVGIGLLQYYCLTKTMADYGKALADDKAEIGSRLAAGVMSMTGGLVELLGGVIEKAAEFNLSWAMGVGEKAIGKIKFIGRGLGFAGGVIMAIWDIMKGIEEFHKKNYLTMTLYLTSAGLGLIVAYMLAFCAFNPFTLALVLIFLGVAYFLENTKDNALQSWIEKNIFGIENSYKTGEEEMREFSKAKS